VQALLPPFEQVFENPWLQPYFLLQRFRDWPTVEQLNELANELGLCVNSGEKLSFGDALRPVKRGDQRDLLDMYEGHIYLTGIVPTRGGSLHDIWNAMVWLHFPKIKCAINKRHIQELKAQYRFPIAKLKNRTKIQDIITRMDEGGCLVAGDQRFVVGHGALENITNGIYGFGCIGIPVPINHATDSISNLDALGAKTILSDSLVHQEFFCQQIEQAPV
jgi:hypothetical protein